MQLCSSRSSPLGLECRFEGPLALTSAGAMEYDILSKTFNHQTEVDRMQVNHFIVTTTDAAEYAYMYSGVLLVVLSLRTPQGAFLVLGEQVIEQNLPEWKES